MMLKDYIVSGISIMAVIAGLVQLVKKLGVKGNALIIVSVIIGFAIGIIYKLTGMYPLMLPWVEVLIFGLFMGLGATGLYSVGDHFVERLADRATLWSAPMPSEPVILVGKLTDEPTDTP